MTISKTNLSNFTWKPKLKLKARSKWSNSPKNNQLPIQSQEDTIKLILFGNFQINFWNLNWKMKFVTKIKIIQRKTTFRLRTRSHIWLRKMIKIHVNPLPTCLNTNNHQAFLSSTKKMSKTRQYPYPKNLSIKTFSNNFSN